MHSAQCTVAVGDVCARGVPVFGRDCRVALRAPRNDPSGRNFLYPQFVNCKL
ncbi:MAG: hypothetical protein LBL66_02950 [Clostridiales bacterium]|nr:hypothetical protein [Clostridiales bacterium]